MNTTIRRLSGANMDIDLATPPEQISWRQDLCPWNAAEGTQTHRCAVKNTSICPYFRGVEYLDTLLCSYPVPPSALLGVQRTEWYPDASISI